MKSKIVLTYTRPPHIPDEPRIQHKSYEYYNDALSTAIDAGLRLALAGYGVIITCDGYEVIKWSPNYINTIYKY